MIHTFKTSLVFAICVGALSITNSFSVSKVETQAQIDNKSETEKESTESVETKSANLYEFSIIGKKNREDEKTLEISKLSDNSGIIQLQNSVKRCSIDRLNKRKGFLRFLDFAPIKFVFKCLSNDYKRLCATIDDIENTEPCPVYKVMLKEKIELTDEQKKIDKIEKTTNFFIASRDTMMEIWCNAMINRFDKQNFDLPKIKKEIFKESGLTIPGGPDVAIVIATTTFKFPNLNDNFSFLDNIGMNSAQKDDEQKRKEINDQKINTEIMGMIALDTAFSSGIPKAYLNATAPFNASFSEDKVQTADPKEPRKAFHLDQKMGVKRVMVLNKKQLKDDFFTEYDLTDSLEKETQEDLIKFINTGKDNMKSVLEKDKWYEDSLLSKTLRLPLLNQQIYHCMKEEFIATERVYNINKEIKRNDAEALAALDEIYKSQPSFEIISNTEFDKIFAILNDSPTHVIDIKTHQDRINRFLKQMEKASHAQ